MRGLTMIKFFKEHLEHISGILNAPVANILIVAGALFDFFSFFSIDFSKGVFPNTSISWPAIIWGTFLVGIGIAVFYLKNSLPLIRIDFKKGQTFTLNQTKVSIQTGRIESVSCPDNNCAVLLPANTSFIDDCITDANSALGAYVQKNFPDRLDGLKKAIKQALSSTPKNSTGNYPPGTTILMPTPFDRPSILLTASTIRSEKSGIKAFPSSICESIDQAFKITSDKKITTLYMPILGSGHGGMNINDALIFLILCIRFWAKHYHHIKQVYIFVEDSKVKEVNGNRALVALIKGGSL
jgi:Domain of unknown function (DUF6430)